MIFDGILATHNGTGGSGTLTCVGQTGSTNFSDVATGTWWIFYTITEWTDATKTTVLQRESGMGTMSFGTTTGTLTRSSPITTWASATYLPKFNTATQAAALTIGNTAANVDITCAPSLGNYLLPMHGYNIGAAGADSIGIAPLSVNAGSALTYGLTTGTVFYFPVWIGHIGPFTKASIRLTTSATAGTSPVPSITIWLYQLTGDTGLPGKRLINFGNVTCTATAPATLTTTALTTPILLPAGWYYVGLLYLVGNGSGSPQVKAYTPIVGPAGTSMANFGPVSGMYLSGQTGMTDPGTAPTAISTGNSAPLVVFQ